MPKGKKFDAAEAHFLKQKEKLDKQIKELRAQLHTAIDDRNRFSHRWELAMAENDELKKQIEALQKLHGLSQKDVQALVRSTESVNTVTELLKLGGVLR